jgi:predicted TIM-barrel fold metal-dependent hydrolase
MTYASGRTYLDADSHIMELPSFLNDHADAAMRGRLPSFVFAGSGKMGEDKIAELAKRGCHDPSTVAELVALGDGILQGPKGYGALGAFERSERTKALDLLGFTQQLVFASFSTGPVFSAETPELARGAMRAHNRGMAEFCADDDRLLGVGAMTLDDVDTALAEVDHIADLGLAAAWIPHRAPATGSPGHLDLDPVWARIVERGLVAVLHIGGSTLRMPEIWTRNGRPLAKDWLGGGENVRGKDLIAVHHAVERFLGVLVFDGVLERHPDLRIGVIELGAGWVPSMLDRLDSVLHNFRRMEADLDSLQRTPTEQIRAQMSFTPFVYEDVGKLIQASHSDLYLFSSDYPHIEGGRDPLGRFESTLTGIDEDARERFYCGNFAKLRSAMHNVA